ncbi:ExbD/TolR family protein [Flavobacterium selenitireducens]|uniref:ExbD/TolR family protein n=1 Tax=Flavobacterium selenitireducens TaxID=2722704 RepID=UPI00168A6DA8|nr:biopolymer transporter ExbD [Flavobacterium selenitireducens]MBD3583225.1 biopolymer transporter ExbD [Flavobacterium selenitireducens]
MAKVKMAKKATSIDMTAMCDVAFLLLTFFILTATAKQPEPLPVDTPNSTNQTKLPDSDLATITIGQKGKVFFGVTGRDLRVSTLEMMAQKYNVTFSQEDKDKFALIENFGVPIENLKQVIDMKAADRNLENVQPGIPKDSLNNQLADWIQYARRAAIDNHNVELTIAIKGDAKEEYPEIKKVMDILQDQKVNSFNLVTGLRGKDF